jgi:hypothetical protein
MRAGEQPGAGEDSHPKTQQGHQGIGDADASAEPPGEPDE